MPKKKILSCEPAFISSRSILGLYQGNASYKKTSYVMSELFCTFLFLKHNHASFYFFSSIYFFLLPYSILFFSVLFSFILFCSFSFFLFFYSFSFFPPIPLLGKIMLQLLVIYKFGLVNKILRMLTCCCVIQLTSYFI